MKPQRTRGTWMQHDKTGRRSQTKRWITKNGPIVVTQLDRCSRCGRFHKENCS